MKKGQEFEIELNIDELVLEGFHPKDRIRIAEALERELAFLLASRSVPEMLQRDVYIRNVTAGQFSFPSNAPANLIGAKTAAAIYQGLVDSTDQRRQFRS